MLFILLAIGLFAVGADQLTKYLLFEHNMPFIPGFIKFESTRNEGMVWGLMNGVNGFTVVISAVTLIVIGVIIWVMIKYRKHMSAGIMISLTAVIGGAAGNLIDRIALGFVRDFICTEFIEFPIFNVADCFVTCGAIALGVLLIFTKRGHEFFNAVFPEESGKTAKKPERSAAAPEKEAEEPEKDSGEKTESPASEEE